VLRNLAVWRVCAIAPSFVTGWWAFSSVALCKSTRPDQPIYQFTRAMVCVPCAEVKDFTQREMEEKARQPEVIDKQTV
jgi:hypothetical protein